MNHYDSIQNLLVKKPKAWLITGVAGFIGSNLLEKLLQLEQTVVGLDNFSTGKRGNLDEVERQVSSEQWSRFTFYEEDIRDVSVCHEVTKSIDYVLHQAALGSVPRSIDDPIATNQNNIDGFLNMLVASRDARVKRFVYAASSSTYGDHQELPKIEDRIGRPLSPYAVTKYVNELYADVFSKTYGINTIGLRYFNVFGKRQDPKGAYAAVIPKWIGQLLNHQIPTINGDGKTSRDFCFVDNAVQANILAAEIVNPNAVNQVYNVAYGAQTSLNALFSTIRRLLSETDPSIQDIHAFFGQERVGDVRHSLADISKAKRLLGYEPAFSVKKGLEMTIQWYATDSDPFRKQIRQSLPS